MKKWVITVVGDDAIAWGPPVTVEARTDLAALKKWCKETAAYCGPTDIWTTVVAVHRPDEIPGDGRHFAVEFEHKRFYYRPLAD